MRGVAGALVLVGVLVGVLAGCSPAPSAVAVPSVPVSLTPTVTATVTPTLTATATPTLTPRVSSTPAVTPKAAPSMQTPLTLEYPLLTRNALYAAGKVPAVRCSLPGSVPRDTAGIARYARMMVDCLNRAWAPLVPRANVEFAPAALVLFGKGVCAPDLDAADRGAFYADGDATICIDPRVWAATSGSNYRTVWLQHTLAHEYGHHVQRLVGIMTTYDMFDSTKELEDSRRMELQASCFAALFMGAEKNALGLRGDRFDEFDYFVTHAGDENAPKHEPDHGSRKSHGYWSHQGYRSTDPASCNTFTAPAKRVS